MYKYEFEQLEKVKVKQSFEGHKTDDEGDIVETINIPVGTVATVYSIGSSSEDNFAITYEFEMNIKGREFTVSVLEENIEKYFAVS